MNRHISKVMLLVFASFVATGCVYKQQSTDMGMMDEKEDQSLKLSGGGPLGGYIEQFMDANDKTRLARALDKGIGNTTTWQNPATTANFAVTPIRKVSNGSGEICRAYQVRMTKSGIADKVSGTACVGKDGAWHTVG